MCHHCERDDDFQADIFTAVLASAAVVIAVLIFLCICHQPSL